MITDEIFFMYFKAKISNYNTTSKIVYQSEREPAGCHVYF